MEKRQAAWLAYVAARALLESVAGESQGEPDCPVAFALQAQWDDAVPLSAILTATAALLGRVAGLIGPGLAGLVVPGTPGLIDIDGGGVIRVARLV